MSTGPQVDVRAMALSKRPDCPNPRTDGRQISVLVVDQDHALADMMSRALRREGWALSTAHDGAAAVAMSCDRRPDVVILDAMLPDMAGLDVLGNMRKHDPRLPLLLLTAKGDVRERVSGLSAAGDDYLSKPFSVEQVVLRVRSMLRRARVAGQEESLIVVGDLVLDEDGRDVSRGGFPIMLTAREFELLRFLMRNSNRVVTKAQILDHVWTYDYDGRSKVVELYMSHLRRKVERPGAPMIHTTRGVGYMIKPVK